LDAGSFCGLLKLVQAGFCTRIANILGSYDGYRFMLLVYIGIRGIELSATVTNIAAIAKVSVLIIFGALGVVYGFTKGLANDFSLSAFIPDFTNTMLYAPAIVYNLLGFELISSIAGKVDNPSKTIPKMTILAGLMIAFLYVFGTFGILAAIPAESVDALDGFFYSLQELTSLFGAASPYVFKVLFALSIFTLMANMISWTLGAVEVLNAADLEKRSPLLAHKNNKYGTSDYSYITMGVLASLRLIINFSLSETAYEVFCTILSFSFVIFLIPYLFLFPSLVKLRYSDQKIYRPYKVPLGQFGLWASAILGEFFIAAAIVLLFIEGDLLYYSVLIIGTLLTSASGYYLYRKGIV